MAKSSVEWQELHGLHTYLQHLRYVKVNATGDKLIDINVAISVVEERIRELEDLGV